MIAPALLDEVLDRVAGRPGLPNDALVAQLRGSFPGVHFTVCSDDDMPARLAAVAANSVCRLYYVASSAHCLALTDDADAASGLVVALLGDAD